MAADGVEQAVAICLAPHNSRTSVGLYKEALASAEAPFPIDFVEEWHDHPLLIEAFAEKLRAGWTQACAQSRARSCRCCSPPISVPKRTITEGDPYEAQTRETAALVAAQVPEIGAVALRVPEPGDVGRRMAGAHRGRHHRTSLREAGHTALFVQPIGFVCDHVEILFDIDILFREFAAQRGMKLYRAESLNDSPLFIRGRLPISCAPGWCGAIAKQTLAAEKCCSPL